jgi:mono/diheme cytochrome c family protein
MNRALVVALVAAATQGCMLRRTAVAPAADIRVSMAAERVARGRYIFENLGDCAGCHAERGKGAGLPKEQGVPGSIVASNITPDPDTGLGRWTDGEKIRAIREGIARNGRALFPVMPYTNYRRMSDQDVESLVAYMNTLEPMRNFLPLSRVNPIVSAYVKNWPRPSGSVTPPDRSDPVHYGEYLATMASCVNCHSPMVRGRPVRAKLFAGGRFFGDGPNRVRSPNITPDEETGIGGWSEQDFVNRFLYKRSVSGRAGPMPWRGLSQLVPEDLRAIYAYLRSQPAVRSQ